MFKLERDLVSFLKEDISQTSSSLESSPNHCNLEPTARKCNQSNLQVPSPFKYRDGDWICHRCKNHNYSFRQTCNRCKKSAQRETDLFFSTETSPLFYRAESDSIYAQYLRPETTDSFRVYSNYGQCLLYGNNMGAVILRQQSDPFSGRFDVQVDSLSDRSGERSPNNGNPDWAKDLQSRDSLDTADASDVETTFYEKQILKSLRDD